MTDTQTTRLTLTAGLDRALAWEGGGSVRYLVADLVAEGGRDAARQAPPLNLALAIDVSGSMAGDKLDAARRTALAVAEALGPTDRLTPARPSCCSMPVQWTRPGAGPRPGRSASWPRAAGPTSSPAGCSPPSTWRSPWPRGQVPRTG